MSEREREREREAGSLGSDVDPPGNVQRYEEYIEHEHHVADVEKQLEKTCTVVT